MTDRCPYCGEDVLSKVLGENSKSKDRRGPKRELRLLLNPAPSPRGNVIINGDRCGYVNNWDAVRHFKIPVYLRHGLTCINPYNLKKCKGINIE